MKANKIIVLMLALVLICAILVACNENGGNNGEQNGQTVTKKPWAQPDSSNEYDDSKKYGNSGTIDSWPDFQGEYILVVLTNSESINNLFYDYVVDDFGKEDFTSVENRMTKSRIKSLENMRNQIKNGIEYNPQDSNTINPKAFTRCVKLTLKNPGKERAIEYIKEMESKYYVLYAVPDTPTGISWFATTSNDPSLTDQWGLEKIKAYDAWDITTAFTSAVISQR